MSHLSLLPNGMQQFCDANGVPFLAGQVFMWIPNTETTKPSWQDMDHIALNSDPIILDAAGRCVIWGEGIYRQVLKDALGNTIWDKLTLYHDFSDLNVATIYDLPIYIQGRPEDAEEFPRVVEVRNARLPAGLTNSRFSVKSSSLPTVSSVFTIRKNDIAIGTVTFDSAGAASVVFAAQVDFVAGDIFSLTSQAVADATGANFSLTFVFTVL